MSTETERQIQALLAEHIGAWSAQTRDDLTAKLAAREAAARREALLEAATHFESEMGPAWGDNRSWFTTGKHVTSLVAEVLRDLAEPERDEESGR